MQRLGRVCELWCYPVSSVGGEQVERLDTVEAGVPGDRQFALFDRTTGLAAAPEKDARWRPALMMRSRPAPQGAPLLSFPDGQWMSVDDASLPDRLTDYFGFAVGIGMTGPSSSLQTSTLPSVSNRYAPSALHLVTTASLNRLAGLIQAESVASRRFRPSLVIESAADGGFVENDWIGATLRIGATRIRIIEATKRCGMTFIAQPGLAEEPEILREVLRHNRRNFGVYGIPDQPGAIAVDDEVYADI